MNLRKLFTASPASLLSKVKNQDKVRLIGIAIVMFFLFSMLFLQFYRIQVIEHEKWEKKAQRQHEWILKIPFKRGSFYTDSTPRSHHPDHAQALVIDVPKYHLFCDALVIPKKDKGEIASSLWSMLSLPDGEKENFIKQFYYKSRSRRLAMWLSKEEQQAIVKWWRSIARKKKIPRNALFFTKDYQRSYPYKHLLGQVLHTIRDYKEEKTHQGIPTGGLELQFNDYLKGKEGKRWSLRSLRHTLRVGGVIEEAQNGADVYLSINQVIQSIAEEELEKGVKRANADSGFVIVMDPDSGELLAIAQYPFFVPSYYQDYFNDSKRIENTKVKAIMDAYEPGSTIKPIMLATFLLANEELERRGEPPLFDPDQKISTSSGRFPGRSKPLKDGRVHKYLNMDLALQNSSNVYLGVLVERLISRLGEEWLKKTLEEHFSFGKPTNIPLPLENPGMLPTPGKRYANGALEWSKATPYSLIMGHNLQTNGLQMLRAFCTLVNGGYLVEPILVKKIVRENGYGEEELLQQSQENKVKVLPDHVVDRILKSMKYVTKFGGTATEGDIKGYTEVGKTGTTYKLIDGKYSQEHYFSSFVGATPLKGKKIAVMVAIDEPEKKFIPGVGKMHHGGRSAAPIFREIAKRSLNYLGIPPDDPHGYPHGDPRRDVNKADWLDEVFELRKTYHVWND
ncbi:MAG: penicillin-binding protein 2 [Chlamydiales bacterium]|nr:penicillin-binding protein 2 [Chlamydiales bacterium]